MKKIKFKKTIFAALAASMLLATACGKENTKEIETSSTEETQELSTEPITSTEEISSRAEEDLSEMKKFEALDGSYSIYLPKDWQQQDTGVNYWIMAGEPNGSSALLVMKCPRLGAAYSNMEEFKDFIHTSYSMTNEKSDSEVPSVEGMLSSSAEDCEVSADNIKGTGYNIYLETEDNYFAIVLLGEEKSVSKYKDMIKKSAETLTLNEVEKTDASVSPVIRWITGTYAPLLIQNSGNINLFGGYEKTELWTNASIQMLQTSWSITDRESLDAMVEELMAGEVHNQAALADYESLGLADFKDKQALLSWCSQEGKTEEEINSISAVYDAVNQYGERAVLAWDLVRAMSVIGYGYIADYYTYEEAFALSVETGKLLQEAYTSWDDMMQNYWYGYQYWAEEDPEDTSSVLYNRKNIYEGLKEEPNSPYSLDWNLELK